MSAEKPGSQSDFAKEMNILSRKIERSRSQIEESAPRLKTLLRHTGCQAILERIVGGKVEFVMSGPNAGKFITEPFSREEVERTLAGPGARAIAGLLAAGIEEDDAFRYDAGEHAASCYAIDPTQADFFKNLQEFVAEAKLDATGLKPTDCERYWQAKVKAEKEARQELWCGLQ